MIDGSTKVQARKLLERGLSKTAVAADLGIARRTLYYWISGGWLDDEAGGAGSGTRSRRPRKSKLDDYKRFIEERLAEFPKMSAVRLYEDVRRSGFEGSYSVVARHVRSVRPQDRVEAVQRFETEPGRQGQVDFAEFKFPWGKRFALVVVLGYSRWMWARLYERQTMAVLVDGLEKSFVAMGGVPRELLFDRMKAVVISDERKAGGKLMENAAFTGFADHWGFKVRACRPYRAQTKGKVERPIRYMRENFFYGRSFAGDADIDERLKRWREQVANVRIHGTLGESVSDRFASERPLPLPLAPRGYRFATPRPMPEPEAKRSEPSAPLPSVDVEQRSLDYYSAERRVS